MIPTLSGGAGASLPLSATGVLELEFIGYKSGRCITTT